ncbi:putative ATP synthase subunit f, mitochondrial [Copidosoma floridanum]|uniref:putative ATP synthase subunit f, mitochondrial n=1 Tax=Copidosoma floridanum TaxID=29053 RepID=UPI0006C9C3DA|nr:putative ATP synthase subunit f, mitochondrial [Copidosoma floridanum]
MGFGDYPAEYNRAVHGPYDPARFYGPKDTAFSELKLNEITAWLGRRNKSPQSFAALCSRAWWRWQHKYVQPKRCGIAPFFQLTFAGMFMFYCINYKRIKHHNNYKYH